MKLKLIFYVIFICMIYSETNDISDVKVTLNIQETPELRQWGKIAQKLSIEWLPRITNLLSSKGFTAPDHIELKLKKSEEGIAGTDGTKIEVSSHWIEKHPDDLGLIVHEVTHVVQCYPNFEPGWVTEGVADYIRWGLYESKPLDWYPLNDKPKGYQDGYRVTAGFFLWLESDLAPGIVRILNTNMRNESYSDDLFKDVTGKELDNLWEGYKNERKQSD